MPKRHPSQMSLPLYPQSEELAPKTYEALKQIDPEWVAYVDNMNRLPENFPEGSEAYLQFTYTGRKKRDKETLKNAQVK